MIAAMSRPPRIRLLAAGLLAAATLATACSTTLSGSGSTGAPIGFPSSAVPSLPSVPSVPAIPGGGSSVTDVAGHFRVRMIGPATRDVQHATVSGEDITVYLHIVRTPSALEEMASETYAPAMPSGNADTILRGEVGGFTGSSGFTVGRQTAFTFRGHPARKALFTGIPGTSREYSFLAVAWSTSRTYLFFARSGTDFQTLTTSFAAI
jgi:hypothetical protein